MIKNWFSLTRFQKAQHVARFFAIYVLIALGSFLMTVQLDPTSNPTLLSETHEFVSGLTFGILNLQGFGILMVACGLLLFIFRHLTIGWYILVTSPLLIIATVALRAWGSGIITFQGFFLYSVIYGFLMFIYWVFADGPQ